MKKLPCSAAAIGEICILFNKRDIAKIAFLKVTDVDDRIKLLMEYEFWDDAA